MPEGDTVWLTAKRLNDALGGEVITTCSLRVTRLALTDLRGETMLEVIARGKHIMMRFSSGRTLHTHLRMDGQWELTQADRAPRRTGEHQIRAVLGNARWRAIGYRVHDLELVATPDESQLVGHLGPDLLGPDWDPGEARRRLLSQPERAIGDALLDQRNLAGLGNMYKVETLYITRVHPWTPVAEVGQLDDVLHTAQRLLRRNRDHPQQSTTGFTRRGEQHWVYLRAGQPCLRCGTAIAFDKQGQAERARDTYWCPTCQPAHGAR